MNSTGNSSKKRELKEDEEPEQEQYEKAKSDETYERAKCDRARGVRIPPLDLQRAREFVPPASPTEKTASDSELLIESELPNIGQPEFTFSPLRSQDSPRLIAPACLSDEAVQLVLQGINSWSFDIFQLDDENLPKLVEKIFRELGLFDNFPLDVRKVQAFTHAMVMRYQPNPYHNFRHACDVLHAVYLILTLVEARKTLSHLEVLALVLAALCHDVDHPGLTNAFLVATYDPLALRYNDKAVLESHHAATCFITMRGNESLNLLAGLSEEEQRHMRKLMITLILATDMGEHARICRELGERIKDQRPFEPSPFYTPPGCLSPSYAGSFSTGSVPAEAKSSGAFSAAKRIPDKVYKNPLSPSPPIQSTSDVTLLIQLIIKCADISNVIKPFFLSKRWAALLLLEWFRQGEIEKQLGLPISKFMDREDPSTLMAMTCGCIDYIAKPMYEWTAKLLPRLHEEVLVNLDLNKQMWSTFTTNGRRASETAHQILGPFAPPPIPKDEALQETFIRAPCKLEGKLVATFSGQYLAVDGPGPRLGSSPSDKSLGSVAEEPEEDVQDSSMTSVTDRSSEFSRLESEAGSSRQASPQYSSTAGTSSPAARPLLEPQEKVPQSTGVEDRLSPRSPESPSVQEPPALRTPRPPGAEETTEKSAGMKSPSASTSPRSPGQEEALVPTSPQPASVKDPILPESPRELGLEEPHVPSSQRSAEVIEGPMSTSPQSDSVRRRSLVWKPTEPVVEEPHIPSSQQLADVIATPVSSSPRSVDVEQTPSSPQTLGLEQPVVPSSPDFGTDQVTHISSSPGFPGVEERVVSSSPGSPELSVPLNMRRPSRGVHFQESMPTSEPFAVRNSILAGSSHDSGVRVSLFTSGPEADFVRVLLEPSISQSSGVEQLSLNGTEESAASSSSEPEIDSRGQPETEEEHQQRYEAPLSLLFGSPTNDDTMLPAKIGKDKNVALVSALLPGANRLIHDRNKTALEQMAFRSPAQQRGARGSIVGRNSFNNSDVDLEKSASTKTGPPLGFWEALRTSPKVNRLNRALESKTWNILLIITTLVALFIDDVVKGFLPKNADVHEAHVLTACLSLFLCESALLCVFRDRYFFSFFFWLDVLGSVTLIPLIIGINSQNLVIARTGRAAKTVTRFSKTLQASHIQRQILNHIPALRVFKFFGFQRDSTLLTTDLEEEEKFSSRPSQLWTRLSELTSQKLILGVLIIIILTPYFNNSEKDLAPLVSLDPVDDYTLDSIAFNQTVTRMMNMTRKHGYNLVYLGVKEGCRSYKEGGVSPCQGIIVTEDYIQIWPDKKKVQDGRKAAQEEYRSTEIISVTSDSTRSQAYYSVKKRSKFKYGMNIALTCLILLLLAAWCFFLSRDSNRLLIQPIERMVEFVKELAEDPVSFAGKTIVKPTGDKSKIMETFFVEAALVKIASLTKVALGDAGMDILSVNLKGSEFNRIVVEALTILTAVAAMLPGKKIRACFGFCDIRNFTDATECLQEDVMMFVNRIADVVHNKVVLHSGFPNKNIGDAFLIVWKKTVSDNTNKSRATSFADRALRSFLDIIQSIETSQSLAEFAKHPAIQKRMPGYRIHMGFGLHVGWAIEGAIGSAHKVDPSYLSPHVNMASRLEAATKQYGVMLLISETVIAHLTKSSLRDSCRKLDRVTVKGSQDPMVLYTFDVPLFQQDLRGNPQEYRDIFEEGVDSYIDGDWDIALERLQECQGLWPTDKPAHVLLNFMSGHNNVAPENWAGFRELTEK